MQPEQGSKGSLRVEGMWKLEQGCTFKKKKHQLIINKLIDSDKYSTCTAVKYNLLQVQFKSSEWCEDIEFVPAVICSEWEGATAKDAADFVYGEFDVFIAP